MYEIGTEVHYHGSREDLHGRTYVIAAHYAGRYALRSTDGGRNLVNVRPASVTPIEQADLRAVLERAIATEQPAMITYVDADGEWTTRTIEPYELFRTRHGDLIVRAMDHRSNEPRSFRLDRIDTLIALPGAFRLERPAPSASARERDALARIRAEIALVAPVGYDDARWTPGDPIV
ncbi:WYL domain-containing protein [[Actinomadura] parvosata]|uniref:WYL domain-containing protein n=1 Tax=[Actinomadura] parvosata TaxID=1955412 RepID=UPI00406CF1CF